MPLKNLNLNYYCQVLQVSPYRINDGLSDKGCQSVTPHSLCLFSSLICSPSKQSYSNIDDFGSISMQMLFSIQIFTRNILTNTSFLNKSKVKFLQIKQDTTKKMLPKTWKEMRKCARAHEAWRSPSSTVAYLPSW